jgi:hypothetical protein
MIGIRIKLFGFFFMVELFKGFDPKFSHYISLASTTIHD